ncbi:MAG: GT4 family glycosyltransferase PelF [Peptostreptococcales bacterium]
MKVCMIVEGSYPYVVGGVSSWVHQLIASFPGIEFNIIAIITDRTLRGKFVYEFPENLTKIYEIYLQDFDWVGKNFKSRKKLRLNTKERDALKSLLVGEDVQWKEVFQIFSKDNLSINKFLMGEEFLNTAMDYYNLRFPEIHFSDFLWTLRSIYLPLIFALKFNPPKADIYHCVSTGYAGIIGSKAVAIHGGSKLLISEHGIYTREREQEIIKAKWIKGIYKNIWIEQFKKMSQGAYMYADIVTALFNESRLLQLELGCPAEKTRVIPNGINIDKFKNIPMKNEGDPFINLGAIVRLTPIKDIKTMITAFFYAHKEQPLLKLWIMGPDDEDKEYANECYELVEYLNVKDIYFLGKINTADYIGKMDMLILTSISEGQPLTILEGFAAKKPSIATNVGNCYGLIHGEEDEFQDAGIVTSIMNVPEISKAILTLANNKELREEMGENGYKRFLKYYNETRLIEDYEDIYNTLGRKEKAVEGG